MIQSFKATLRPNGWEATYDFQIGAEWWAWVLSEELKCALHDWLDQGCKGVKRKRDDVGPELTEPVSKIQLDVDDDVEDGVRISNAIFAQGDNLSVEAALERSHVQYNSSHFLLTFASFWTKIMIKRVSFFEFFFQNLWKMHPIKLPKFLGLIQLDRRIKLRYSRGSTWPKDFEQSQSRAARSCNRSMWTAPIYTAELQRPVSWRPI